MIFCQTLLQLADPTQLKLVGVGVDFVFPKEGRKEDGRKEERKNPQLASSRMHGPTCLNFSYCLVGV